MNADNRLHEDYWTLLVAQTLLRTRVYVTHDMRQANITTWLPEGVLVGAAEHGPLLLRHTVVHSASSFLWLARVPAKAQHLQVG